MKNYKPLISFAWHKTGVQFLLLACITFLFSYFISPEDFGFHTAFCVTGLIIIFVNLRKLKSANLEVVLTDHRIVFSASFSLYFLIGASLLSLGSTELVEQTFFSYQVDAIDALRIDATNASGFAIALLVSSIVKPRLLARMVSTVAPRLSRINLTTFILLFFSVGAITRTYITLNDLSVEAQPISGFWRQTAKLLLLGIFLAAMYRGKRRKLFWFGALLVSILSSTIGLLGFSKQEFLLPIMAFLAGWSIRANSLIMLFATLVVAVLLTGAVFGSIQYARVALKDAAGLRLSQRLELIMAGLEANKKLDQRTQDRVWNRINYMHQQMAGMQLHDAGNGGDDIRRILWTFVPRMIAPGKPIMSKAGAELNYKISGHTRSSQSMGIFIEGYYNLGWAGFILWSVICGFIISQTSAIARRIIYGKIVPLFPFAFLGVFIAFRIDANMISDCLGVFMYIVYFIVSACLFLQRPWWQGRYRTCPHQMNGATSLHS